MASKKHHKRKTRRHKTRRRRKRRRKRRRDRRRVDRGGDNPFAWMYRHSPEYKYIGDHYVTKKKNPGSFKKDFKGAFTWHGATGGRRGGSRKCGNYFTDCEYSLVGGRRRRGGGRRCGNYNASCRYTGGSRRRKRGGRGCGNSLADCDIGMRHK